MYETMMVSLIIPVYNEEKILRDTCARLVAFMEKSYERYEILFSNDGSVDTSAAILTQLAEEYPAVRAVGYEKNRGKGCAVRTGMLASKGDLCLFTDCDLAYGTDVLKQLSDELEKTGADIVIGSRSLGKDGYSGYSFLRKWMSKTYLKLLALLTGFSHSDSQSGIKGFRGDVARAVFAKCQVDGFAFDLEALILAEKAGCRIGEMPVKILDNREKESKVNPFQDALKMLKDVRLIKKRIKNSDCRVVFDKNDGEK